MIGYELVSEEEAAAHMKVGTWVHRALLALRDAGIGRIARVKLKPDSKTKYSNVAGEYSRRLGMAIKCWTKDGYLWIEYLGERPTWEKNLPPERAQATRDIVRRLGK